MEGLKFVFLTIFLAIVGKSRGTIVSELSCDFNVLTLCNYTQTDQHGLFWYWADGAFTSSGQIVTGCFPNSGQCKDAELPYPPFQGGYLVITPTSDSDALYKWAGLQSPVVTVTEEEPLCLEFDWFNTYCHTGTSSLQVEIKDPVTGKWFTLMELGCFTDRSKRRWFSEQVQLPVGTYQIIFYGLYHNRYYIAIDDIMVSRGKCQNNVAMPTPGDCAFEDFYSCGYRFTEDSDFRARMLRKEHVEYGLGAPEGKFMMLTQFEYQTYPRNSKTKIISPDINMTTEGCLSIDYYNSILPKDNDQVLNLYLNVNGSAELLGALEKKYGDEATKWHHATLALPLGSYQLIVEMILDRAITGSNRVGVDSIEISHEPCAQVSQKPAEVCAVNEAMDNHLCGGSQAGTCVSMGRKSFLCNCKYDNTRNHGFHGSRCQHAYQCDIPENQCQNSGECITSGRYSSRCECPRGTNGTHCEFAADCGVPPSDLIWGASLTFYNTTTVGSKSFYECSPELKGNPSQTLEAECYYSTYSKLAYWTAYGRCEHIDCGNPPNTTYGLELVNVTKTTWGGKATYKCGDGYGPVDPNWTGHTLTCLETGNWTQLPGPNEVCVQKQECGAPPKVKHATLVSNEGVGLGDRATYQCDDGYRAPSDYPAQCGIIRDPNDYGEIPTNPSYEWILLPECQPYCQVQAGTSGEKTAIRVEVKECRSTSILTFPTDTTCDDAITYNFVKDEHKEYDNMIFSGSDLCAVERYTKEIKLNDNTVKDNENLLPKESKCISFCISEANPSHHLVTYEEITYEPDYPTRVKKTMHYYRVLTD